MPFQAGDVEQSIETLFEPTRIWLFGKPFPTITFNRDSMSGLGNAVGGGRGPNNANEFKDYDTHLAPPAPNDSPMPPKRIERTLRSGEKSFLPGSIAFRSKVITTRCRGRCCFWLQKREDRRRKQWEGRADPLHLIRSSPVLAQGTGISRTISWSGGSTGRTSPYASTSRLPIIKRYYSIRARSMDAVQPRAGTWLGAVI